VNHGTTAGEFVYTPLKRLIQPRSQGRYWTAVYGTACTSAYLGAERRKWKFNEERSFEFDRLRVRSDILRIKRATMVSV
jgi:hypothetical protein